MKKLLSIFVLAILVAAPAFADCGKGGCDMKHGGMGGEKEHSCPIAQKFFMKAEFLLANQAEIGLSPDQAAAIEQMKFEMERTQVRQEADMQVFMLDLMQSLKADKPDVEAINQLIDKSTPAMAQAAKESVAAIVKLKSLLTPEQMAKMKQLWMQKKSH